MFFFNKNTRCLADILDGFYDIHSHFLPGVDDGAPDSERSTKLLDRMKEMGVKGIYLTPHIISGAYDNRTEDDMRDVFSKLSYEGIDIRLAAEYFIDDHFPEHIAGNPLHMGGNHILAEFSMQGYSLQGFDMLFDASLAGYEIIIAHPERYAFLQRDGQDKVINLIKQHKLQLNLLSLTGYHGSGAKACAERLIKANRYSFVGTDTHSNQYLDMLQNTKVSEKLFNAVKAIADNNKILFE